MNGQDFTLSAEPVISSSEWFARGRTVRRRLDRWWKDEPKRLAAWLMLNPSNATENRDDPTTKRITHFSRRWGYDGWIVVNLYPFVSAVPELMWKRSNWRQNHDWEARDDLQQNLDDIESVARVAAIRLVAFGAAPVTKDEPWLELCLERFGQPADNLADKTLYCLGTTKNGQPLHPLARGRFRVSDDTEPVAWERPND